MTRDSILRLSGPGQTFTPDVNYLGTVNALAVMEVIRILGPISRAELARQSQFKPAALTGLVRYLIEEGLVIESEETRSTPSSGRPARLLQVNSGSKSVLGIDIEPDHLRMAVTDLGGAILSYRQIVCDRRQTPEERFELIKSVTRDMGVKPGDVVRVGASVVGVTFIARYGWATMTKSTPCKASTCSNTRAEELSVTWTARRSRPPAASRTACTRVSFWRSVIHGPSPQVPARNKPSTPRRTWCSTIFATLSRSISRFSVNGVGDADQI